MPFLTYITDNLGILFSGSAEITGGTVSEVGGYTFHYFDSTDYLEVPGLASVTSIDLLVVGGALGS